jgi:voltage-gated potassium channel
VSVIAIDTRESALREIAVAHAKSSFSYVVGDATDDDMIAQTNLADARGMVAALSSDKDNLYLVVSGRQSNSTMRIIARAAELQQVDKIKRAGADGVVSPNYIGGMRMVSELLRPAVVKFLDEMLRDQRAAYRIEEVQLGDDVGSLGKTLRDAKVRERFGMTVLAIRDAEKQGWCYNPDPSEALGPGMTLVVLGSPDQVAELRRQAGVPRLPTHS